MRRDSLESGVRSLRTGAKRPELGLRTPPPGPVPSLPLTPDSGLSPDPDRRNKYTGFGVLTDKTKMADGPTVVLNGGGLRSIVATAVAITDAQPGEIVLVHLRDGRPNAAVRADHVRRQARHFDISRVIELDLPHLQTTLRPAADEDQSISPLTRPQMVLAALGQAIRLRACRLVWPMQLDADFDAASRLTEQVVLIEHLAQLEQEHSTSIRMPLLELTDQELIELGSQLEVPWSLAWTCAYGRNEPCATCPPCLQRHAAFKAAGIVDPSAQQTAAGRTA